MFLNILTSEGVIEQVTATGGIVFSVAPTLTEYKRDLPFGIGRTEVWLEPAILPQKSDFLHLMARSLVSSLSMIFWGRSHFL